MAIYEDQEQLNVKLAVSGAAIPIAMLVPTRAVKLRRMLPVIQTMSSQFVEMGEFSLNEAGKSISCKAGCGACCRQLVPVAEAEAYMLRELIDSMPEDRRSETVARFEAAESVLDRYNFFERLEIAAASDDDNAYDQLVKEYFSMQIACPFLEAESCSIHNSRPIACREYLVTSPAENCSDPDGKGIETVRHFFQVKESLITISINRSQKSLPFVPLVNVLRWADAKKDESPSRTGREWMKRFFDQLSKFSRPISG